MQIQSLDDLKAAVPLVFELRAKLAAVLVETELEFREERERLLAHGASDDYLQERYARMKDSLVPVRREIEAIDKRLVNIVSSLPPKPISLTFLAASR